jgi:hypothetical protein
MGRLVPCGLEPLNITMNHIFNFATRASSIGTLSPYPIKLCHEHSLSFSTFQHFRRAPGSATEQDLTLPLPLGFVTRTAIHLEKLDVYWEVSSLTSLNE